MCPPADYLRALGVEAERVVKVPGGQILRYSLTEPRRDDR
jgi:hypothetical protein